MMLIVALGVALIMVTLWDALETMILTHNVDRKLSITNVYYRYVDKVFLCVGTWTEKKPELRDRILTPYAPLSLLALVGLWASLLITGFALVCFGLGIVFTTLADPSFGDYWYATAVTFFTLGYGDLITTSNAGRIVMVITAGTGFGFLAVVISYLPVLYANFSRREATILLLDARAGSPPCAAELLRRHGACGSEPLRELLFDFEKWSASLLEATISYPILTYYRSQHERLGWVAAITVVLDTCALIEAFVVPDSPETKRLVRQAELTFAMTRHLIVDMAYLLGMQPRPVATMRLQDGDVQQLRALLVNSGFEVKDGSDQLAELRGQYETYLGGLQRNLFVEIPPFISPDHARDAWETSAWDNRQHF
jgi:hypothetical protein